MIAINWRAPGSGAEMLRITINISGIRYTRPPSKGHHRDAAPIPILLRGFYEPLDATRARNVARFASFVACRSILAAGVYHSCEVRS